MDPTAETNTTGAVSSTIPMRSLTSRISLPPNRANSSSRTSTSSSSEATTTRFRMQAKNFFITFPQCGTTKQQALDNIRAAGFGLKGAIVAQEQHADGAPHLHIGLFLADKLSTRNPHVFDFIAQSHGNYQTMTHTKACCRYITKDDAEPLIFGDVPNYSEDSSRSKSDSVAGMIESGSTLQDVAAAYPGFFLLNKRKVEDFAAFCSEKRLLLSLRPMTLPIRYNGQSRATASIIEWLNTNLRTVRPFKSPQLYIFGPHNHFKTTLVQTLESYLKIYRLPPLEDYYDYYNDSYELCVIDEFKANKTIQFLNEFLQGSTMNLKIKGSQIIKRANPPVIILSNYAPTECYKDLNKIETLLTRLQVIELDSPIDIENIIFQENSE